MNKRTILFSATLAILGASAVAQDAWAAAATCPGPDVTGSHWEVKHWDKIIFKIVGNRSDTHSRYRHNTELDIKVEDDPDEVADLKDKVVKFLERDYSNGNVKRQHIHIVDVEYAIDCELVRKSP